MLKNYLRVLVRNFKRNSVTALINVFGLSIGLATCMIAVLYINLELSADKFHKDIESIYYVKTQYNEFQLFGSPLPLNDMLKNSFPEVEATLHTYEEETMLQIEQETFKHDVLFAELDFLTFFTFPLKQGDESKALDGKYQVVISDEINQRYFKNTNAVGKTIRIWMNNEPRDFEITGIALPPPAYSSIKFDFIVPFNNTPFSEAGQDSFSRMVVSSFIKVNSEYLKKINDAIPQLVKPHLIGEQNPDGSFSKKFTLHPLAGHRLSGGFYQGGGLQPGTNINALYGFSGIALLILVLACFNFMNLTNAQSSGRVIEIGIRKVTGAEKKHLIRQFLIEAVVLSLLAALLALGLAELGLLLFKNLLTISVSVFSLQHTTVYLLFVAIAVITGLAAGSYPALVLSNLEPTRMFKHYFKVSGSNWLTRSVLSIQFGLSMLLIICALVMWKQQDYLMNKDLGYGTKQVLVLPLVQNDSASISMLKTKIKELPEVARVSKSSSSITRGTGASVSKNADNSMQLILMASIDTDFIETMKMTVVKGEAFHEDRHNNRSFIIVNETFVRKLEIGDSIGIKLNRSFGPSKNPTIVGVVKDFNHASLNSGIMPFMFFLQPELGNAHLNILLNPGQLATGLEKIRALYTQLNPDLPFEYFFLEDDVQKQYEEEVRWSKIITLATGMAVFLSVLGLLGLVMFTVEKRKKEIGIRKVMGASLRQLVGLLSKDYFLLISITFIVIAPLSYYLMQTYWLNKFAYHTTIDAFVYLYAFCLVVGVAGLVVGSQIIRAAGQNPTDTLKEN